MLNLNENAENLGEALEMDVVDRLVSVAGLKVLDVGCGDGRIARQLAERGAETTGIEPDSFQAEKNCRAKPVPGLTFIEAPGQALPIADKSIDGVFFGFSFHHVPRQHMDGALNEAARVLKPDSGFLYVLEPMMEGSLEDVCRPFHDETKVRTNAYDVLNRFASRFVEMRELHYSETVLYDNFATFVDEIAGSTYTIMPREKVDTPRVRDLFERGRLEDGYAFAQHSRVNFFRGPRPCIDKK